MERVLVGRGDELSALTDAWAAVCAGHGRCVLVGGEPGIGKTRIVEELAARLPGERVLWGRCLEAEGAPAYWPWILVLRSYVARRSPETLGAELGASAADLGRLVPALRAAVPGAPELPPLEPEQARFRLFDALGALLRHAGEAAPLAVLIEDLHWADSESLLLLRFVASELREARVLLIGTYRDAEVRQATAVSRVLGDLVRLADRLPLRGLGEEDVARFVEAAGGGASPALVRRLHGATGGNPFFLCEVLELLRAEGGLGAERGTRAGDFRVPDSVREAIRRRLDPLPAPTRRVLAVAAVLGAAVDVTPLAGTAELPADDVLAALEPALTLGILSAEPDQPSRFRFAHALLQDTLLADLPAAERADLHRRAGELLERLHAHDVGPHLGELAHHFFQAAPVAGLEKAIGYAVRAGVRAMTGLGFEEAAGHFERALEAGRGPRSDPGLRLRLLLQLSEALRRAGDEEGARATCLEAARLAKDRGDGEAMAAAALGYGAARAETGLLDRTLVGLLEEALAAAGEGDSATRASLLAALAQALYFSPDASGREARSLEAVAVARRVGTPAALAAALVARHFVLWRAGHSAERLVLASEMLALAEQADRPEMTAEARAWRILDLLELGEIAEADRELHRHAGDAERLQLPHYRWHATLARAARALFDGRADEAEALGQQALAIRQLGPSNNAEHFFAVQLFFVRRAQGRLAELADAVAAMAERLGFLPIWRCGHALLEAELGRHESARRTLDGFAARGFAELPPDANRLPALALLAEVCALVGDGVCAAELHALLLPYAGQNLVNGTTVVLLGPVDRYLGLLALAAGRPSDAAAHFETAVASCARMGARPDLARAQAGLARALAARGTPEDRSRAATLLAEARAAAEQLGLPGLVAADEREVRAAPVATLRREGDVWTFAYGAEVVRVRDTKGLGYLVRLLREPDREVAVRELAGADAGRASAAEVERARVNVTRAIGGVIRKVTAACPQLGRHLEGAVRTGALCTYAPDPTLPIRWEITELPG